MYIYVYIHIYISMYIYIYVYIHIHWCCIVNTKLLQYRDRQTNGKSIRRIKPPVNKDGKEMFSSSE